MISLTGMARGTPIGFHIKNDHNKNPVESEVVQAATKWKRMALKQFEMGQGEGIVTDMRAVRKDYFLDHDHSAYVDQWDWERVMSEDQRTLDHLKDIVQKIWKILKGAEKLVQVRSRNLCVSPNLNPTISTQLLDHYFNEIIHVNNWIPVE